MFHYVAKRNQTVHLDSAALNLWPTPMLPANTGRKCALHAAEWNARVWRSASEPSACRSVTLMTEDRIQPPTLKDALSPNLCPVFLLLDHTVTASHRHWGFLLKRCEVATLLNVCFVANKKMKVYSCFCATLKKTHYILSIKLNKT